MVLVVCKLMIIVEMKIFVPVGREKSIRLRFFIFILCQWCFFFSGFCSTQGPRYLEYFLYSLFILIMFIFTVFYLDIWCRLVIWFVVHDLIQCAAAGLFWSQTSHWLCISAILPIHLVIVWTSLWTIMCSITYTLLQLNTSHASHLHVYCVTV